MAAMVILPLAIALSVNIFSVLHVVFSYIDNFSVTKSLDISQFLKLHATGHVMFAALLLLNTTALWRCHSWQIMHRLSWLLFMLWPAHELRSTSKAGIIVGTFWKSWSLSALLYCFDALWREMQNMWRVVMVSRVSWPEGRYEMQFEVREQVTEPMRPGQVYPCHLKDSIIG